ncbi:MAG: tandem-95 repeat protein [Fibrobacteraceae bacterium]|nr:tandem-95 repeat protein [Fibrobacteraceae bacterium]
MNRLKSVSALLAVSALALVSGVTAQESANAPAQAPATEQAATPAPSAEQVPAAPVEEASAPSVSGIPGEFIQEGGKFAKIKLSQYVTDEIDKPEAIRWAVSGQKQLKVSLKGTEVSIETPDAYWNGAEDLTFTATNSKGKSASETVNFTVESVNNAPEFSKKIPDQTIDEKQQFATIKLDDFIKDVDHKVSEMTWETNVVAVGKEQAEGDLSVEIDANRVAKIVIPDPNWFGSADVTFTAADPEYATVATTARFTVKPINDAPVLKQIPSQTIEEKNTFESINLADFVSDVDDAVETLKWSVSGGKDLKVELDKYGSANIVLPNENWSGAPETFTFTVKDSKGATASSQVTFTVKSINDAPEFAEAIPDQTIDEKQEFKTIALDKYVKDIDHEFAKLKWTVSGNKDLKVQINGKEAKVLIPSKSWNGEESITFKVTDPEGASAETSAMFTVNSVNDAPSFVKPISAQNINEKAQFATIKLDDFITDPDHKKEEMSWEVSVAHEGKQPESGTLDITIDDKRVAKVNIPDVYWNGNVVATFTATDPEGASVKQDVKLSVKSINDVPKFTQQIPSQSIEEKGEFSSFNLTDYIADADHATEDLKIDVSGNKDLKIAVDKKTREVSVKTPNELWNGEEKVTFTVTDPEGASAKQVVSFAAKSVNDAPVMKDIPAQKIKEKESFAEIALDKFVEDKDHDFAKLKWTVSGNKDLKVQIAGKTAKVLTPNKMWHGEETLVFKVTDPEGASDERSVVFTVESINDVPEFVKQVQEQTINEKAQFKQIRLDELVKDADHKNEELKWEFDIKPVKGSAEGLAVNIDQNRVATIAIPNKFWNGSADITFKVSDPEGASATSKATFTVKSVNDAPVFAKAIENQTIQEKQEFQSFALADLITDPDHEFSKLKISVSGNKDLKVNVGKDGVVSVKTPNELWNGEEKVTFTVTDPEGATAKQVVSFLVKSVNDVPVLKEIPAQKIKEKESFAEIALDKYVEDKDHDFSKLKWTVSGNKELKVQVSGKVAKIVIPNKMWHGEEILNFKVTDPEGASAEATVNFTVESVNDVPEFVKQVQGQAINEKAQFKQIRLDELVKDADHKNEELKWEFDIKPAKGSAEGLTVNVDQNRVATIAIPNKFWNGSADITFKVSDPEGASATSKATFTVKSVNDAPVFVKAVENQTIQEKAQFKSFNLAELVKDEDHEFSKLKVDVSGNKDLKVKVGKDGEVTIATPNELWNGTEKITFTVTDPEGAVAKQVVTFVVKSVNDVPVFVKQIPDQKIKEKGEFKAINLDDFVKDADHPASKLKWSFAGNKTLKITVSGERQLKVAIPNKYWNGEEKVTFTVTDPEGAKASQDVIFTVESINDKPEFVRQIQNQTIDEKKQFAQIRLCDMVKDFDHKPEDLKWSWKAEKYVEKAEQPKKAKKKVKKAEKPETTQQTDLKVGLTKDGVASILIPDKNWNGAAKITFTVTDPEGATASASAVFTVKSVNDAPVISKNASQGETIREGEKFKSILLSSLASDADHSASDLNWAVSGNKDLKVKINKDNTVSVSTPDAQWNGRETLTFTVTDPEGAKASHRMTFVVTPVNDSPKIQKIANQTIKEGEKFTPVRLDQFVKDPDNKPAEMKWSVKNIKDIKKGLKVEITPSRQLQVTAENQHFWCPSQPITLRVADPAGYADTMTVFYEIKSVNDAPVMKDIQDQKIREKGQFREIKLDQFVMDADHNKESLVWTAKVEKVEKEQPAKKTKKKSKKNKKNEEPKVETPDMTVVIDKNRIATIKVPSPQWNGVCKITFTVTDPEGAKASKTAVFEVESVNDAPVFKAIAPQTIKEKEKFKSVSLNELVSDPDHPLSALSFSVAETRNLKASIDKKNQLIVSIPDKYWSGSEKVSVTVTDPEGAKATQQVLYTVQPVNDPPKISKIASQTIKEKERFAPIDLSNVAKDPDNKPTELKWTVSGNKELKVEIKGTRANVTTPNTNWYGQETLVFKVSDPSGLSDEAKVTFKVTPVNDPPTFKQIKPFEIKEKQEFPVIDLSSYVVDPDNKITELYFTRDDGEPEGKDKRGRKTKAKAPKMKRELDYSFNEGKLSVSVPNSYWNGSETITIHAFDPSGEKASAQVRFVVHPVNDPPQISDIPGEKILEGKSFKAISLDKYVKDPDNKPAELKWSVSGARMLNVQISGARVATIKPKKADWFGSEKITFIVRDPAGITAKTTAEFIIQHVNAVPEMRDIPDYTIKENENGGVLAVLKLNQLARDRDHRFNELKWSFSGNKYLTVTHDKYKNTMTIAQPYSHWKGAPEKITFTVTDPEGAKVSKTAKFTVIAVNNPPVAVAQHYQTQEGTSLNVSEREGLMNGSSDPDNEQAVKVILVNKPKNGSVKLNEKDGSFVYEPKKGFSGIDEFTFKLQDKGGAMSQVQTAEINVTFKLRDVRNQQSAAPVVKKEEDKPKEDKKAKSSKKKSKKKRGKR